MDKISAVFTAAYKSRQYDDTWGVNDAAKPGDRTRPYKAMSEASAEWKLLLPLKR